MIVYSAGLIASGETENDTRLILAIAREGERRFGRMSIASRGAISNAASFAPDL